MAELLCRLSASAGPVSAESSASPLPKLPPPEVTPTPEGVPTAKQPPVPSPPRIEPAIPPVPMTVPQLRRPAESTPLAPTPILSTVPPIVPHVDILWALPSNPQVARLRDMPEPPGVQETHDLFPTRYPRVRQGEGRILALLQCLQNDPASHPRFRQCRNGSQCPIGRALTGRAT